MTVTLSCLYDDYETAKQVVRDLEAAGLPSRDISIIAKERPKMRTADHGGNGHGAEIGAGLGAMLGGAAGLLAGLGMLAIPGIGPVVAAGWLASTAVGAVAGGAAGGLIGTLTEAGISREHAHVYAESVKRGSTLVVARVPNGDSARFKAIMDRGAVNLEERKAALHQSGWKEFNENAPPHLADQAFHDHGRYGAADVETENTRLRRLVADLSLENQALKDSARSHRG